MIALNNPGVTEIPAASSCSVAKAVSKAGALGILDIFTLRLALAKYLWSSASYNPASVSPPTGPKRTATSASARPGRTPAATPALSIL